MRVWSSCAVQGNASEPKARSLVSSAVSRETSGHGVHTETALCRTEIFTRFNRFTVSVLKKKHKCTNMETEMSLKRIQSKDALTVNRFITFISVQHLCTSCTVTEVISRLQQ